MGDQYIGEVRYFTYIRGAPSGWLACDGSVQRISDYEALGSLLGGLYGGDGQTTFGLPDMRGRVAIGSSVAIPLASSIGRETVTLTTDQLPQHDHDLEASTAAATQTSPVGQVFATGAAGAQIYTAPEQPAKLSAMNGTMIGSTGQGLPHANCAPTLPLLPCIAWDGVYPVQNS